MTLKEIYTQRNHVIANFKTQLIGTSTTLTTLNGLSMNIKTIRKANQLIITQLHCDKVCCLVALNFCPLICLMSSCQQLQRSKLSTAFSQFPGERGTDATYVRKPYCTLSRSVKKNHNCPSCGKTSLISKPLTNIACPAWTQNTKAGIAHCQRLWWSGSEKLKKHASYLLASSRLWLQTEQTPKQTHSCLLRLRVRFGCAALDQRSAITDRQSALGHVTTFQHLLLFEFLLNLCLLKRGNYCSL